MVPATRPRRPATAAAAAPVPAGGGERGCGRWSGCEREGVLLAAEAPAIAAAAPLPKEDEEEELERGVERGAVPVARGVRPPLDRQRPPRLRFPLLLLLLVGPAAGAPAPAPARTLISVDSPTGLPDGCENPMTGDPMPANAEWPDAAACRLLLCRLDARGRPVVEVVGCVPHVVAEGCRFEAARGEQATSSFPACCGRYVCSQEPTHSPSPSPVGFRSSLDEAAKGTALVVYAV